MANTYIVELAVDFSAIEINTLVGCNSRILYMPACNTLKGAVSTYSQFRINPTAVPPDPDVIGFRIVDMTSIQGGMVLPYEPQLKSLYLEFQKARSQTPSSPFESYQSLMTTDFGPSTPTHSVLFNQSLNANAVTFGGEPFIAFVNGGFFAATYTLKVDLNGTEHTYRHDPEWIVDPF